MKLRSGKTYGAATRYMPYIRTALRVGRAAYNVYRGVRGRTASARTIRGGGDGNGITTQHDRTFQYRYKKLNRRKRRMIKKRVKRFNRMLARSLGTNTILRNDSITSTVATAAQQGYGTVVMYGWDGTNNANECGNDDVYQIVANDGRITSSTKIKFYDCVMDVTFRNTGQSSMELDVYEFYTRADNMPYTSTGSIFGNADADTPIIGAGASLGVGTRGVTPFELPVFCENIKILKKVKYFLPTGNSGTFQMKNRKIKELWGSDIGDVSGGVGHGKIFHRNGWTKGLIFICKSMVGEEQGPGLTVGCTRVYRYTINDVAQAQDARI